MDRRILSKVAVVAIGALMGLVPALPASAQVVPAFHVHIVNQGGTCTSLFCFQPQTASVASGTKVVWKNVSGAAHTVTRCTVAACGVSGGTGTDTGFGSSVIVPGTKYKFVFHGRGTYVYYCQIHGYALMHGTVTVP
jgi:plastocyanin